MKSSNISSPIGGVTYSSFNDVCEKFAEAVVGNDFEKVKSLLEKYSHKDQHTKIFEYRHDVRVSSLRTLNFEFF